MCALKVYDDCNAGVPEKIIRDVTGHRSNALHLYERPTVEQKKVSNILIHGSQEKENSGPPIGQDQEARPTLSQAPSNSFNGLSQCSVTVSNMVINVTQHKQQPIFDVDSLLKGIQLEQLMQT